MPSLQVLEFGESSNISCSASASIVSTSDLIYSWMLNDEVLLDETNSWLFIEYYDISDAAQLGGIYKCRVTSSDMRFAGVSKGHLILMAPHLIEQPQDTNTYFTDSVHLTCTVVGHPTPVIEWYKVGSDGNFTDINSVLENRQSLPNSSYYETATANSTETSVLTISSVDYEDYGYYMCVASFNDSSVVFARSCCSNDNNSMTESPLFSLHHTLSRLVVISGILIQILINLIHEIMGFCLLYSFPRRQRNCYSSCCNC